MPDTLVSTKLYIPPPRPDLGARPRRTDRLEAGTRDKLTLISAPVGYGKSTLVSGWVAHSKVPAASLSNQEIAVEPYLSVNTVKWYARNIYSKLEVGNRRDAVIKARELGIL
jgi:ATP/maltotriose-dependent transcriptional regulator MalT